MESKKIYEDSYKTIENLLKQCTGDSMTIDFKKMDIYTAEELRTSINHVLLKRKRSIAAMIFNTAE